MVEREDIGDGIVEVFGLIKECLAMESGEVFVKVGGEEINACRPCFQCLFVMLNGVVIILNSLRS